MSRSMTLFVLGLVALFSTGAPTEAALGGAQEGMAAPNFSLNPVNGASVTLKKLIAGKGGVVAFADPRARDGQRLFSFLEGAQKAFKEQTVGVVAAAINTGQRETVETFVKDSGLTLPVAHDEGGQLAKQFGVDTSASVVVIDHKGIIRKRFDSTVTSGDLGPQVLEAVKLMTTEEDQDNQDNTGGDKPDTKPKPVTPAPAPVPTMSDAEALARIHAGLDLLQAGFTAAALDNARGVVAARPTDSLANLWLAYVLEATMNYPEAAVTYRKVLALQPTNKYAAERIQHIDPEGRWLTPADLPPPKPDKPGAAERNSGTSSQGSSAIGS